MIAPRYFKAVVALLPLTLFTGGCTSLPPQTDLGQSRAALTAALDAWKAGQPNEKLREHSPPVDFRDISWEQGSKLKSYEVQKAEVSGVSAKFTVKMDITEKNGTSRSRVVVYSADTGPTIVIRPDSLVLD